MSLYPDILPFQYQTFEVSTDDNDREWIVYDNLQEVCKSVIRIHCYDKRVTVTWILFIAILISGGVSPSW